MVKYNKGLSVFLIPVIVKRIIAYSLNPIIASDPLKRFVKGFYDPAQKIPVHDGLISAVCHCWTILVSVPLENAM